MNSHRDAKLLAVLSVCSPEELEDGSSSDDDVAERALIDQLPDDRE